MIAVDGISRSFGDVVALSDVSFELDSGVTSLLGPNGAGKSTLLRIICGMTAPSNGRVRILDRVPGRDVELYRHLSFVPEREGVPERLRAHEFVRLAAVLTGIADSDSAAAGALRRVELGPQDQRPLRAYSKGMRQRVKIAQALVGAPRVLVMDEPLNGLDPRGRISMTELIQSLGDAGVCVLVSSHVLDEVERFGSRVLVLGRGRLLAEGDYRAIRELLEDRPHRLRVVTDQPRDLVSGLVDEGVVVGARLDGDEAVVVETVDARAFRRLLPVVARRQRVRLQEVLPLDDDLESVFRYLQEP